MKLRLILLTTCFISILSSLNLTFKNDEFTQKQLKGYSYLSSKNSYPTNIKGSPQKRLINYYFEIPKYTKIKNITVRAVNVSKQKLLNRLMPNIKNSVFQANTFTSLQVNEEKYANSKNFKYLQNFGNGIAGNSNIGYISVYGFNYNDMNKTVEIPEKFDINIELEPANNQQFFAKNLSSSFVDKQSHNSIRSEQNLGYLLIVPNGFTEYYQSLIEWRKIQGFNVQVAELDDIESTEGIDIQEKTRNFIKNKHYQSPLSFVTIAVSTNTIPSRSFFAFDCQFGGYDDENEIPADMYYACLNGNFDANNNGIYGEDNDEPDYFPDLYVSRLPLQNNEEITNYITRLIAYEKGEIDNYQKAAGLSQDLWEGSASEACQNYIYSRWFDSYNVDFLYGNRNTVENAFNLLEQNQNIVQHTGHGNIGILSLTEGYIRNSNVYNLNNAWGGLFYSIGCWTLALDYDSIGQNLVTKTNGGYLGYVGNSRYGWGAPSAPGFGFSEFYQKEFFKNLFEDDIQYLAQANASQKLPFIGYWQGKSVFKWVGYQLNSVGDAAFKINIKNPKSLSVKVYSVTGGYAYVKITDENGFNVQNCKVMGNNIEEEVFYTDENGIVKLEESYLNTEIKAYKNGHRFWQGVINPESNIAFSIPNKLFLLKQGQDVTIKPSIKNTTTEELTLSYSFDYADSLLIVSTDARLINLPANSYKYLPEINLKLTELSELMPNNTVFDFKIIAKNAYSNQKIDSLTVNLKLQKPEIALTGTKCFDEKITPGSSGKIQICFENKTFNLDNMVSNFKAKLSSQNNLPAYLNLKTSNTSFSFYNNKNVIKNVFYELNKDAPAIFSHEVFIDCYLDNKYYNTQSFMFYSDKINLIENFDDEQSIFEGDSNWQIVSNVSSSGAKCYSPRPSATGEYTVKSPRLIFSKNSSKIEFAYKYVMPMYGKDGLYVLIERQSRTDTLTFMGSGGALGTREDPQTYIFADWDNYSYDLNNLANSLTEGEPFYINLKFVCGEIFDNFNNYSQMPTIGIFIDDFSYNTEIDGNISYASDIFKNSLTLAPNPFNEKLAIKFEIVKAGPTKLEIFNIKGQRVFSTPNRHLEPDEYPTIWNAKSKNGKKMATGVYFVRLTNNGKSIIKKVLLLK